MLGQILVFHMFELRFQQYNLLVYRRSYIPTLAQKSKSMFWCGAAFYVWSSFVKEYRQVSQNQTGFNCDEFLTKNVDNLDVAESQAFLLKYMYILIVFLPLSKDDTSTVLSAALRTCFWLFYLEGTNGTQVYIIDEKCETEV